jgi:formylglycine-generating enzyme required for sulfatase activity
LQYEYVAGGDLAGLIREWHRRAAPPTPERAARVMLRLSETVGYCHRLTPRIIHRDLKPANILTQRVDVKTLRFKIADFGIGGIASAQAVQVSRRGASVGYMMTSLVRGSCTPMYASPRQLLGADPDPWDDVHALGVIWHQILTGNLGQGRPTCSRWWRQSLEARGMTSALIDLLESCFEEDPSVHPADAAVLAERLAAALKAPSRVDPAPRTTSKAEAAAPSTSPTPPSRFTNSLGMTMVRIEPGEFLMGSTEKEIQLLLKQWPDTNKDWLAWERPEHKVRITKPFYLAAHQVTVGQFREFVKAKNFRTDAETSGGSYAWDGTQWNLDPKANWKNPGFEQGDDHPVVCVSHNDALAFINWLNSKENRERRTYRLPTEAEWEYACRAGTRGLYGGNEDDPESLARVANVADASAKKALNLTHTIKSDDGYVYTAPVGRFDARWGLYDMIGNVWEWCADGFDENAYEERASRPSPVVDPRGPVGAPGRVFRGGGWSGDPRDCRPAFRDGDELEGRINDLGFRVAAVQEQG